MKAEAPGRCAPAAEPSRRQAGIPRRPLPRVPRAGSRRQGRLATRGTARDLQAIPERLSRPGHLVHARTLTRRTPALGSHVAPLRPPHFRCLLMTSTPARGLPGASALSSARPQRTFPGWRLRAGGLVCRLARCLGDASAVQNKSPLLASVWSACGSLGLPRAWGFCPPDRPDPKAHFDSWAGPGPPCRGHQNILSLQTPCLNSWMNPRKWNPRAEAGPKGFGQGQAKYKEKGESGIVCRSDPALPEGKDT